MALRKAQDELKHFSSPGLAAQDGSLLREGVKKEPVGVTHSGPRLRSVCVSPAAGAQGERRGARTRSRDPFIGFGISPVPGRRQTVQLCACARVSCTCTGLQLAHRTRCAPGRPRPEGESLRRHKLAQPRDLSTAAPIGIHNPAGARLESRSLGKYGTKPILICTHSHSTA